MIDDDDPRIAETHRAIAAYWDAIGPSDSDVISYLINPMFQGKPEWPNTRQAYRVVRPEGALIIASDGLADPFVGTDDESASGFGMEVYLETPDLVGAGFEDIRASWAFALIEAFAMNVADWGGIAPQLRQHGVMSTELPGLDDLPGDWASPTGAAGLLINASSEGRAPSLAAPLGPVLMTPVTLLRPDELAFVAEGGAAARAELTKRLASRGWAHRSSLSRSSVL